MSPAASRFLPRIYNIYDTGFFAYIGENQGCKRCFWQKTAEKNRKKFVFELDFWFYGDILRDVLRQMLFSASGGLHQKTSKNLRFWLAKLKIGDILSYVLLLVLRKRCWKADDWKTSKNLRKLTCKVKNRWYIMNPSPDDGDSSWTQQALERVRSGAGWLKIE